MVVEGGYDVQPTANVSSKYECQICLLILRRPVQTLCGHRFCQICLNNLFRQKGENIICPIDRQTIDMKKLFDDRAYEREILDIQVKCSNHNSGCDWTGELRDLESHVGNHCMKEKISCENDNCKTRVFRSNFHDHMTNYCLYRALNCIHCNDQYIYANSKEHWNSCKRFPMICNNNCGVIEIPRNEMQEHLSKCPLTVVTCSFENIGCTTKQCLMFNIKKKLLLFQRKLKKEHLEEYTQIHLELAVTKITELEKTCQQEQEKTQQRITRWIEKLKTEIQLLKSKLQKKQQREKNLCAHVEGLESQIQNLKLEQQKRSQQGREQLRQHGVWFFNEYDNRGSITQLQIFEGQLKIPKSQLQEHRNEIENLKWLLQEREKDLRTLKLQLQDLERR